MWFAGLLSNIFLGGSVHRSACAWSRASKHQLLGKCVRNVSTSWASATTGLSAFLGGITSPSLMVAISVCTKLFVENYVSLEMRSLMRGSFRSYVALATPQLQGLRCGRGNVSKLEVCTLRKSENWTTGRERMSLMVLAHNIL